MRLGLAPGYIDLDAGKFSADAVRETSGFSVVPAGDVYPQAAPTEEGKKAGIVPFGQTTVKLSILFSPVPEKGDVVLAKYTNGLPCVVYRPARGGNHPEIFCGTPRVPYELIKFAEKNRGRPRLCGQPRKRNRKRRISFGLRYRRRLGDARCKIRQTRLGYRDKKENRKRPHFKIGNEKGRY